MVFITGGIYQLKDNKPSSSQSEYFKMLTQKENRTLHLTAKGQVSFVLDYELLMASLGFMEVRRRGSLVGRLRRCGQMCLNWKWRLKTWNNK